MMKSVNDLVAQQKRIISSYPFSEKRIDLVCKICALYCNAIQQTEEWKNAFNNAKITVFAWEYGNALVSQKTTEAYGRADSIKFERSVYYGR